MGSSVKFFADWPNDWAICRVYPLRALGALFSPMVHVYGHTTPHQSTASPQTSRTSRIAPDRAFMPKAEPPGRSSQFGPDSPAPSPRRAQVPPFVDHPPKRRVWVWSCCYCGRARIRIHEQNCPSCGVARCPNCSLQRIGA
ncbi:hypothetical protein GQ53DRAFT_521511 [Thozetella sp. PMI_491]|nr:hypothetical protein GQ53DRAFT_521511 [Thozetella sp. PMI_491]